MSARSGKDNFIVAHYELLALGVAVVALALAAIKAIAVFGDDPNNSATTITHRLKANPKGDSGVKAADLSDFQRVYGLLKKSPVVQALPTDGGNFLVSESRVFCENAKCGAPIPADAKSCPVCGQSMVKAEKQVYDTDGDGMPDEWEKKYGLDPKSPADALLDKDSDGFNNLEEFTAKTDPTDRRSHPNYLDSLQLKGSPTQKLMDFIFTGVSKTPAGLKYQFKSKNPKHANDYNRGIYSVLAGEKIGDTGFVAKAYEAKSKKRKIAGGMETTVDVSEAVVERISDKRKINMTIDRKQVPLDTLVTLIYTRNGIKEYTVAEGDTIELNGSKYVIKSIKGTGKATRVEISPIGSSAIKTLEPLEG